jgi:indole-3-glycerol phosphate synthase
MPKITLDTILAATRTRVAALRVRTRELERRAAQAPAPRSFAAALGGPSIGVIAEVKRRSPSAGAIAEDLDPVAHAAAYARGGAVAISVLTDQAHFGGSLEDLERVVREVPRPVLRKDFILDELQLLEARGAGASAILLIVRALDAGGLRQLARAARDLGLGVLVEAHNDVELDAAVAVAPTAIGVNSRDLATFTVDHAVAERLVARVPRHIPAVAESGIAGRADVERFAAAGADLVLVGTAIARTADPAAAVRDLCGVPRRGRPQQ